MARHHERYAPDEDDHGIGDIARRHAEADYADRFGTGGRTQNLPEDYGTGGAPEPFDRGYRNEYGRYEERYGERLPPRVRGHGWDQSPRGEPPGWRGDAGLGRGYSGHYESLQRSEPPRYGDRAGREQARGFRGRGPKNYARSDERIQEDVNERLWDADDVDASDVSVEVKDGEVTLRGNVEQRSIRHRIEDIVDGCGGIKDIHNEIRVQPRNEWPYDKGVAAGSMARSRQDSGRTGRDEGMTQSAIDEMPPRG